MARTKIHEEDLVNATHKARLSQRDSEPSHLANVPKEDIGGVESVDAEPNTAKVDGAKGMSQDTTIPRSVPAEKTHLDRILNSEPEEAANDVEIDFGEDGSGDDLDQALDSFEAMDASDVDVEVNDHDEDDKDEDEKDKKENPFVKKESRKVKGRKLNEEPFPEDPGASERGDAASAIKADEKEPEDALNSGPNTVKEDEEEPGDPEDKEDKEQVFPFGKKPEKEVEEDVEPYEAGELEKTTASAKEPAAAMNGHVEEALKIKIKLPKTSLFESAGMSKRDQKKIGVVLESVLKDLTKQITPQVHQHYKRLHEQKLAKRDAVLAKQIDSYMTYVVEEWVKTNKVAIRQSLRTQLAEDFLNKLQVLFNEHYIDVPASKVDLVKELTKQVSGLKKSLSEQTAKTMKLKKLTEAVNKQRVLLDFARKANLSEAQTAKLTKLANSTQYVTGKDFREKLGMLAESYFPGTKKLTKPLIAESEVGDAKVEEKTPKTVGNPMIDAVLEANKRLADSKAW